MRLERDDRGAHFHRVGRLRRYSTVRPRKVWAESNCSRREKFIERAVSEQPILCLEKEFCQAVRHELRSIDCEEAWARTARRARACAPICDVIEHIRGKSEKRQQRRKELKSFVAQDFIGVETGSGLRSCHHRFRDSGPDVAIGSNTRMVVPRPSSLAAWTVPPCSCAMCFTMERPSPVPPSSRWRALSAR